MGWTVLGATVEREQTPDGRRLAVSRHIDADAEACWDLLTDTGRWPEWGPSIRDVDCERRYIREGTTGHLRTVGGIRVPFEVTACGDDRWRWQVARIPATGHRVEGEDPSRVVFEVPLLAGGYVPACAKGLQELARLADS